MLVDHYAILGLSASATKEEIKIAYRKLARQHHPDLNPNDLTASDRFRAIQTAYETLTRPHLRQAYLEKRWYAQYRNESLETDALILDRIVQQAVQLERFVDSLDPHRMDRHGLTQHIRQLIHNWMSVQLDAEKERSIVETILKLMIHSSRHLSLESCRFIHQDLHNWLQQNQCAFLLTNDWLIKKERSERWQRWIPVGMIVLTLILAGIIWLVS